MQSFTLATITFLAGTGLAAPSINARSYVQVQVQFQGAAGVAQTQYVPADGSTYPVYSDFSVSHIAIINDVPASVNCFAEGVDGSETYTYGTETVDVGPPQVQMSISCYQSPA
ncbi:hypothetical protein TruAng_008655 [Truncatella angustata]|nr:hypothetical protein TruAng_008655 [Truncatella angustata]